MKSLIDEEDEHAEIVIADVRAGTGAWLIDVAYEYNEARIDGFDIDLCRSSPTECLPSRCRMWAWDHFSEVLHQFLEKYDLVHVRSLSLYNDRDLIQAAIQNFYKILKPGGRLQWEELIYVDLVV